MSVELRDGVYYIKAKNVVLRVGTDLVQAADKPPLSVSKGGTFTFQIDTDGYIRQTDGMLVESTTTSILEVGSA